MMCKKVLIKVDTWKGKKCIEVQVPCNPETPYEKLIEYAYEIYNR